MIDLHTHVLPGIDDGSKSVEMSLEMLRTCARQGVHTVVATSHFYASRNLPERFLEKRQQALERLGELPSDCPRLLLGAEVAYFDGISRSQELCQLRLGDSDLLLIEMPFDRWTSRMIAELEDIPVNLGLTPVLAHVDRYLHRDQFPTHRRWLQEQGVLFQCNTSAFLKFTTRRWALKRMQERDLHFLGTDTHNLDTRRPNMAEATAVITKKLGKDTLDQFAARATDLLSL